MSLLCKRYDMIALLLQTVPKAHHNLAQLIITLNSPQANITVAPALRQVPQGVFSVYTLSFLINDRIASTATFIAMVVSVTLSFGIASPAVI